MNLQQRKDLLITLGSYMAGKDEAWLRSKEKAFMENPWFIPEFIEHAVQQIVQHFLQEEKLQKLIDQYRLPEENHAPKKLGIVMAGNIPLVGFHDFLCVFITGHIAIIKPSSKDDALIRHLAAKMMEWNEQASSKILFADMLKNCDAYIATGSNNSSRYFEYYFRKYPSIIRRNRTSIAILNGKETSEQLARLADDVYLYFGLGCRNVSKIYVPEGYDFIPLLEAFSKYNHLAEHHKFKNNYDYNLAVLLLNNKYYMTNGSILLVENESLISPISQLNYEFYKEEDGPGSMEKIKEQLQCVIGKDHMSFGSGQYPDLCDYADGIDTMQFLVDLSVEKEVRRP